MSDDLISRNALISEFEWLKFVVNESSKDEVEETIRRIRNAPAVEAEPVIYAQWVDRYGEKYANRMYECSACKKTALYDIEVDVLGHEHLVQVRSASCPHCHAKMNSKE